MRKITYNRALSILRKKRETFIFSRRHRKKAVFDSHSKENYFVV